MAQAHTTKKSAHTSTKPASHAMESATKIASNTATKATNAALSAVESSRNSAESMMHLSTKTMKEFFSSGAGEAHKAHEKAFALGREGTENISRSVDALTRTINDMVSLARENVDAALEVSHIAADIAKSISTELVSCSNSNFSDNVEIAKEAFSCRNINDALEIQSKWLSTNMDNFFTQSTRFAEMYFQLATEAAEPINERVAEATERFSKAMAA